MAQRLLTAKVLLPLAALFMAGTGAFAGLYATKDSGGEPYDIVLTACDPVKDPNCTPRGAAHVHADLRVVIRGKPIDFNKKEYLSTEDEENHPWTHIHPPRTTVVHAHLQATTWREFLEDGAKFKVVDTGLVGTTKDKTCITLPPVEGGEKLCNTATERWTFIVNGVKVDGISNLDITDLQRVLITYGSESDEQIMAQYAQVTDQACVPSERCLDRIDPNEPKEVCSASDGCTVPGR